MRLKEFLKQYFTIMHAWPLLLFYQKHTKAWWRHKINGVCLLDVTCLYVCGQIQVVKHDVCLEKIYICRWMVALPDDTVLLIHCYLEIPSKHQQKGAGWPDISYIMSVHPTPSFSYLFRRNVTRIVCMTDVYGCIPRE